MFIAKPVNALSICPFSTAWIEYIPSISVKSEVISGRYVHENRSSSEDTVSRTASRIMSSTITIGGQAEFNAIVKKLNLSAEVSLGYSTTTSFTVTMKVPPYTKKALEWGSMVMQTIGTINNWDVYCNLVSYQTTAIYTFSEFSRSYDIPW